ncbi:hypothetical protein M409DRAFT_18297 [Zasmidium cellare ATCC 36951]|uniref:Methyltransferase domain-containing protein n=1 Tax=Zasmidium cellare ATCC 36951 TaxID=1080233 RepID=A0A6A6CYA7_ZASCE|nr:uncharacterized protein M409DRAFT_18297 [Zasmidium cellare ATCC 36951]KAF2171180.1 hypothetical protein M409DRAFT_18297 [Zasmidium cellare ATCC 36951]
MAATEQDIQSGKMSRWYKPDLDINQSFREILEKYSGIPPDQVLSHINAVRDKAWAIHPYPCVGQGQFLSPTTAQHALYPEIVQRLQTGEEKFLDLGCAFGQDIRRLVVDGVDSANCYGSDLLPDFIDLGYELFQDKGKLQTKFFAGDVFDESSALGELNGTVDIISANAFFHLFNWDMQKKASLRVVKLLKPKEGSLVVGRQLGNQKPGEQSRWTNQGTAYRHDMASLQRFWDEVGEEVGARFRVDGFEQIVDELRNKAGESTLTWMEFSVRRMS